MIRRPPRSTLFPYTRSSDLERDGLEVIRALRAEHPQPTIVAMSGGGRTGHGDDRSEEHTSELQSQSNLVCRLLLEKKQARSAALPNLQGSPCRYCPHLSEPR